MTEHLDSLYVYLDHVKLWSGHWCICTPMK